VFYNVKLSLFSSVQFYKSAEMVVGVMHNVLSDHSRLVGSAAFAFDVVIRYIAFVVMFTNIVFDLFGLEFILFFPKS